MHDLSIADLRSRKGEKKKGTCSFRCLVGRPPGRPPVRMMRSDAEHHAYCIVFTSGIVCHWVDSGGPLREDESYDMMFLFPLELRDSQSKQGDPADVFSFDMPLAKTTARCKKNKKKYCQSHTALSIYLATYFHKASVANAWEVIYISGRHLIRTHKCVREERTRHPMTWVALSLYRKHFCRDTCGLLSALLIMYPRQKSVIQKKRCPQFRVFAGVRHSRIHNTGGVHWQIILSVKCVVVPGVLTRFVLRYSLLRHLKEVNSTAYSGHCRHGTITWPAQGPYPLPSTL